MRTIVLGVTLFVQMSGVCGLARATEPTGEWLVRNGEARVRIMSCANGLWGYISWVREPGIDSNNPDPAKRARSIIGVPIIQNMMPASQNRWQGQAYNIQNGKTYSARMTLLGDNELSIEGCVLGGLICGGENWTRIGKFAPALRTDTPKKMCYD